MYISASCACQGRSEEVSDLLELVSWVVVSNHVGCQTLVFCKSHLSSPPPQNFTKFLHFSDLTFFVIFFFQDKLLCSFGACSGTSSCKPGWPQTHRDPPVSAFQVLELKVCSSTTQLGGVVAFLRRVTAVAFLKLSL